jgi:hypothetical protein
MRRVLCLVAFLTAGPAAAQVKPNSSEIASGEILLFDGETTFGWKIDGEAAVKDGWLVLGGAKATTAVPTTSLPASFIKIEVVFDDKLPAANRPKVSLTAKHADVGPSGRAITAFPCGGERTRIRIDVPAGATVKIRRLSVGIGGTAPLFNGKDLTGWKVFAGEKYKSKFAVTAAGELSVKDGPGDLQTEKTFGDFVLQLECKTNGKALNSGVFFRCLADQYQQGYEAQIQNAYKDDDRTKPADFGTGAIYRRIAARKVVSNDNEWFTMTVAADGKHIATWVNGYQTVDWTDDRPAEENARKGYRAGKGHLSIQGHDPTTDLLFRNIRIAELK